MIRCVGQEQIACTRSSTREGSGGALSLRDKRKLEGEGAAFIIAFYFHLPIVPWQLSHLYPLFLIRDRSYEFKSKLKSFLPFRAARWKWPFEMEIENIIFLIYRKELYLFIFPCNKRSLPIWLVIKGGMGCKNFFLGTSWATYFNHIKILYPWRRRKIFLIFSYTFLLSKFDIYIRKKDWMKE